MYSAQLTEIRVPKVRKVPDPAAGPVHRPADAIGRLPGETSCLILVCANLDCARGWGGLTVTTNAPFLLQNLHRSLPEPPRQLRPRAVTAVGDDERGRECQCRRLPSPPDRSLARPFCTSSGRYQSGPVFGQFAFCYRGIGYEACMAITEARTEGRAILGCHVSRRRPLRSRPASRRPDLGPVAAARTQKGRDQNFRRRNGKNSNKPVS